MSTSRTPDPRCAIVVVSGVSGSGKTTIGRRLAETLDWPFADADDFHSEANKAKMAGGQPLSEADRAPWLADMSAWIGEQETANRCAVLACSALRKDHRDALADGHPSVRFVSLALSEDEVRRRVRARTGHFAKESLVDSQFATLEELGPDEPGLPVDADDDIDKVVARVRGVLRVLADDPQGTAGDVSA